MSVETAGLRGIVLRGLRWSTAQTVVDMVVYVTTVIVLSRILFPEEVGIVATAMGIVGLLIVIAQAGAGPALIRLKEIDKEHVGAALWLNLVVSVLLMAAVTFSAPWLADRLGIEELDEVLPVISWVIVLHTFGSLFECLAEREMRFRATAAVNFVSSVFGYSLISIACALAGLGFWSIVAGQIGRFAVKFVLFSLISGRYWSASFSWSALVDILNFGVPDSIARTAQEVSTSLDRAMIGGLLGADMAGLYVRSRQMVLIGAIGIAQPLDTVLFPAMSRVQDDPVRLARAFRATLALIGLIVFPAILFIAVASEPLVPFVLGDHWHGVVVPLQILAFGVFYMAYDSFTGVLARAVGRVRGRMVIQAANAAMVLVAVAALHPFGLEGICIGILCAMLISALLMARQSADILQVSILQSLKPLGPGLLLAIILTVLWFGAYVIAGPEAIQLTGIFVFCLFSIPFSLFMLLITPKLILSKELREIRADIIKRIS